MPEEHLRLFSGFHMQRSREKRRREKRGRGKRKDEERGERGERKGYACVWGCATCLAARQTGRQRRGLWANARRWLETSGEGTLPFYSPLGCRMAGVLCAGGKMNERGGAWLGLYGDSNVHLC